MEQLKRNTVWYVREMDRVQCEQVLSMESVPCGTFVYRDSSMGRNSVALSIKEKKDKAFSIRHVLAVTFYDTVGKQYYIFVDNESEKRYSSLDELVENLSICNKRFVIVRNANSLDFYNRLNGQNIFSHHLLTINEPIQLHDEYIGMLRMLFTAFAANKVCIELFQEVCEWMDEHKLTQEQHVVHLNHIGKSVDDFSAIFDSLQTE